MRKYSHDAYELSITFFTDGIFQFSKNKKESSVLNSISSLKLYRKIRRMMKRTA